jgi:hypothetical protein
MSTPTVAPAPQGEQAAPGSPELFNRRTISAMELSTDVSLFEGDGRLATAPRAVAS